MNKIAVDWLPNSALQNDAMKQALSAHIATWGKRWFVSSKFDVGTLSSVYMPQRAPRDSTQIDCNDADRVKLALHALGVASGDGNCSDADRAFLLELSGTILADLAAGFDRVAPGSSPVLPPSEDSGANSIRFGVEDGTGSEILVVSISAACAVPLRKAIMTPAPHAGANQPVSDAVGQCEVQFRAVLGEGQLSLTALENLAMNDVLVLDTRVTDPIVLAVDGAENSFAKAQFTSDQTALEFADFLFGEQG